MRQEGRNKKILKAQPVYNKDYGKSTPAAGMTTIADRKTLIT